MRPTADERRRELATAAADAFHREGFHRVTLGGVAGAVGVTAPAVYRHFANKNALLAGAVETGLEEIEAAMRAAEGGGLDTVLDHLATAALRRPDFWTLLQREIRHLDDAAQHRARERFRAFATSVGDAVAAARPDLRGDPDARDLVVTAAMAVLATPSSHPSRLPAGRLHALLVAAAAAACASSVPQAPAPGGRAPADPPASRAEEVLDTALALFHRRGFAAVSLDDIGAAVGIAGPSIYHHYASKADLLAAAADRILARLPHAGPDVAPAVALRAYVELAVGARESLGAYVTERIELPAGAADRVEWAAADDLDRWSAMLRTGRPELDADEAALLVHAARTVVHDTVRIGRLHRRPRIVDELVAVAGAVLTAGRPPLPGP